MSTHPSTFTSLILLASNHISLFMNEYVGDIGHREAARLDSRVEKTGQKRRRNWTLTHREAMGYTKSAFTYRQDRATVEIDPSGLRGLRGE